MAKPTIELHLNPDEWYHSPEMASGSDEVLNYDQLRERIDYYLGGGSIEPSRLKNREEIIQRWCNGLDGMASLRFVDELDKFLQGEQRRSKGFRGQILRIICYIIYSYSRITDYLI